MLSRTSIVALGALAASVSGLGLVNCASSSSSPEATAQLESSPKVAVPRSASVSLREPATFGEALPDETETQLAISLRIQDEDGLAQLLADQQNPSSPRYHQWVTPAQFGDRFGLSVETYERIVAWLGAEGFAVTRYPNRLFLEAHGTAAGVRRLLNVQPRWASARGQTFRSYAEDLVLPADIAPHVAKIGGLDTRLHLRRRLDVTFQGQALQVLGAGDMRALYDISTTETGASGLTLAVLGTQQGTTKGKNSNPAAPFVPPSTPAIQEYLTSVSTASVAYNPIVMPNTGDDFDSDGANGEYELDVEMQSVGSPNAKQIDLVLSPASVVFQTGAQYIVNSLSTAVAVSTSLGDCESEEVSEDGGATTPGSDAYLFRAAVKQGLAEGQTWFAAAGDDGADDCADSDSATNNGFGGGNATVDFPCSVPEIVCMGGTQLGAAGNWNTSGALTAWQAEVVWNEPDQVAGGGGGQSLIYTKPAYQNGVGPKASDGARDVPDLALSAAIETPGVGTYDEGTATSAGAIDIVGGTSVASPLAAGIFAHLSGQIGCRLGDVHPALYALGAAQQSGGAQPFHDITSGNNNMLDFDGGLTITGFAAGPGYDLASGWGSVDLAKLEAAWPPCGSVIGPDGGPVEETDGGTGSSSGASSGGGTSSGGTSSGGTSSGGTSSGGASSGGTSNPGTSSGGTTGTPGASSGCGCTAAGTTSSGAPLVGLLGVLGLAVSRRRRARA